ncbi:hypothetical protein IWX63_002207 [Arthrobacter sp. CAN_A2]|uniref:hypothetical protein n=1 Tax=Arthrobacter sp. CAN_A2 TaxID=2787718 RepID=UPI0018F05747
MEKNQNLQPNQIGTLPEGVVPSGTGPSNAARSGAAFFRSPAQHILAVVRSLEPMPLSSDPEELLRQMQVLDDLQDALALAEARIILSIAMDEFHARAASRSPAADQRRR